MSALTRLPAAKDSLLTAGGALARAVRAVPRSRLLLLAGVLFLVPSGLFVAHLAFVDHAPTVVQVVETRAAPSPADRFLSRDAVVWRDANGVVHRGKVAG